MLITVSQIKKASENKGWKMEHNINHESKTDNFRSSMIGVNYFPFMWAWFSVLEFDGQEIVTFNHVYSQNNGYTDKSFKKGMMVENRLIKAAK